MPRPRPWQLVTAVTAVAGVAAIGLGADSGEADSIATIDLDAASPDAALTPLPEVDDPRAHGPGLVTPAAPLVSDSSAPSAVSVTSLLSADTASSPASVTSA